MGASVLIVDDEPLLRRMLRLLIERDGRCRVCGEAGDGQEALDLVEALEPDLVLLELEIPVVDGLEVLAELRRPAGPEVVVFTGHPSPVARAVALGLGATGFLSKGEQNLARLLNTLAAASPDRRRPARPPHLRHNGKEAPVTDEQRAEIEEILVDLRTEESDQHAERGHASNRLLRAVARLEQLVQASTDPATRPSPHGDASTVRV